MLVVPETEVNADLRAVLIAWNERALRDLLHTFPSGKVGLFFLGEEWMQTTLEELYEGRLLPVREGISQPAFWGGKRGSGSGRDLEADPFYREPEKRGQQEESTLTRANGEVNGSKDPLLAHYAQLGQAGGRRERAQFLAEGMLLVQRAIEDGLPIANLLYTPTLSRTPEGERLLQAAQQARIGCFRATEGLLGKVTTSRPVPPVMAAIYTEWRSAERFHTTPETVLLVAENINNPDNLGMILRTADAAGAEGIVVTGEGSDPFHKNCVRAARGAVGRVPILSCPALPGYLRRLQTQGFTVVGAALGGEGKLYRSVLKPPIVIVVGNEQSGISLPVLEACTQLVEIPMAPKQDSLNVGVAAGLMLYEVFRQKITEP